MRLAAKTLYTLEAWGDAAQAYKEIRGLVDLSTIDEINLIESLENSGKTTEAHDLCHKLKNKAPFLATREKIALITLIHKLEGKKQAQTFLSRMPSFSVEKGPAIAELTELYLNLGDIESAYALSGSYEELLSQSETGLKSLIMISKHENDNKKTRSYVKKLIRLNPLLAARYTASIDHYENLQERASIEKGLIKALKTKEELKPIVAIESTLAYLQENPSSNLEGEMHSMMHSLKEYAKAYPMHAKLARLQAEGHLIQEDYRLAEELANRAVSLDPHSTYNYKVLAKVSELNGQSERAVEVLERASKLPYFDVQFEELTMSDDKKSLLR